MPGVLPSRRGYAYVFQKMKLFRTTQSTKWKKIFVGWLSNRGLASRICKTKTTKTKNKTIFKKLNIKLAT